MSNFLIYLIFNITGIKVFFIIFGVVSLCILVPLLHIAKYVRVYGEE